MLLAFSRWRLRRCELSGRLLWFLIESTRVELLTYFFASVARLQNVKTSKTLRLSLEKIGKATAAVFSEHVTYRRNDKAKFRCVAFKFGHSVLAVAKPCQGLLKTTFPSGFELYSLLYIKKL